jgi:hypothetical protein
MKTGTPVCCTICGEVRTHPDGWFLLTENQWTDRLKILSWNEALVGHQGVLAACSAAHVQQMVVHWMAVGSLEYPMARVPSDTTRWARKRRGTGSAKVAEADLNGSRVVGELAGHRESLSRELRENPDSLVGILEALVNALTGHQRPVDAEREEEETESYALTEV